MRFVESPRVGVGEFLELESCSVIALPLQLFNSPTPEPAALVGHFPVSAFASARKCALFSGCFTARRS
jgi:hypothetical protein